MPPDGFRVTQHPPASEPIDLTRQISAATWSSSVPGGFGDATLTIPRILTQKERGLLGLVTIEHEGRVLFEGRVEDAFATGDQNGVQTQLQAFGLQRLLTGTSIRRIWSLRTSLNLQVASLAKGSISSGSLVLANDLIAYTFGPYLAGKPSFYPAGYLNAYNLLNGFRIVPTANLAGNQCGQVTITLPAGLSAARIKFDALLADTSLDNAWALTVYSTADGVTYTLASQTLLAGLSKFVSIDVPVVYNATEIRISACAILTGVTADGTGNATFLEVANLRVLGTALTEDTAGGFYGGTILRDVVASCQGLYPGTIEDGSDFALAEIARVNRSTALDIVNEIAPLYAREWAVWEGGRFDWITPDLKASGWVVPLGAATAWSLEQSMDGVSNRVYVTFTDAADNLAKETYVDSGQARNPFVRTGQQNDVVVAAPAAMTSITAPLLAAKLSNDTGRWPDITGTITLPAGAKISAAGGGRQIPAYAIRAGDNITIPELPVEDIYAAGQDGQSVFHVTDVAATTDGTVQLSLEGLTRRADVLLARLSAVSA